MTAEELKDAMRRRCPVLCKGLGSLKDDGRKFEYTCVTAVIYRYVDGIERVSAELKDRCSRSSVIVDSEHVSLKE